MSDFDEWLRAVCFQRPTDSVRDLAMDAWNHQQARIASLEAENARLREAAQSVVDSATPHYDRWVNGVTRICINRLVEILGGGDGQNVTTP